MKLPLLYDTVGQVFVVEDAEWGDFVEPQIYRSRRLWHHDCPKQGFVKLTERVTVCPYCEETRPPMKVPAKSDDKS